jgi:hypothetical protein
LVDRAHIAAACASIALIAATLSPLLRDPADDGFPLSTYPMFATRRVTTLTMSYALGEGAAGQRIILAPELVGTGEVLQAMRVVERAVGGGAPAMHALCDAIASRIAADPDYAAVRGVRIVTGTHDAVEYLSHDRVGRERERARCVVAR